MTSHSPDEEPCPTCGGSKTIQHRPLFRQGHINVKSDKVCPDCGGEGTMTAYRQDRDVGP